MPGRRVAAASLLAVLAGCGGGERQDAGAPSGEFSVEVTRASFPERQSLARRATLRLDVRNTGARAVPNLAVVVETEGAAAFAATAGGDGLADASRPVWLLDEGPRGGTTAYVGTWALGRLAKGATRSVRFGLTPVRAGRHEVRWRVAPALAGDAVFAGGGRTRGAFRVTISDAPVDVPAR